jgi:hypothetical protein
MALAEKNPIAGEIAIVESRGALGTGDTEAMIASIVKRFPARVGGASRRGEAVRLLDAGAPRSSSDRGEAGDPCRSCEGGVIAGLDE